MAQGHFSDQALKSATSLGGPPALSQVFIDGQHAIPRPAERHGLLGKVVLPLGGLAVLQHLLGRGLSHIDDGYFRKVRWSDFRRTRKRQGRGFSASPRS